MLPRMLDFIYFIHTLSMHTRFTSLVSGLTLSVLLAAPVLAQTPLDIGEEKDLIMSCQQANVPTYRASLDEALLALRGSIVNQWKRQVELRVSATRPPRRAAVQRALQQAGTQLDAAFDRFTKTQTDSLDKDVNVAIDSYIRLDDQAEEAALARWSDRDVSFQVLNVALSRAERSLRLYATLRDRTALSRVWNSTHTQAEDAFVQDRDTARQHFVESMDGCIAGVKSDDYVEGPPVNEPGAEVKVDEKKEAPPAEKSVEKAPPSTSLEGTRVLEAQLARSGAGPIVGCGQYTVEYTGYVRMSQPGASFTYHFERSDGARSSDQVGTVGAMGATNVSYNWTISQPMYGWVRLVITSPAFPDSPSLATDFTYTAGANCNTSNTNTSNQTKADARLVVDGKADVNTCGPYRYTFAGTIIYGTSGVVKYYWLRSDGVATTPETVTFDAAGSKTVVSTWDLSATYAGWVRLMLISPNTTQAQANFTLIEACSTPTKTPDTQTQPPAPAPSTEKKGIVASVTLAGKQEVNLCGNYRFSFQGSISTDNAAKITYRWERSDGVTSPEQVVSVEKPGTYAVAETWDLSGSYAGWVRLHVLSPADVSSNQAPFTLTQMCK